MRHTTHIMLGSNAGKILRSIKQYAIKYGDREINDFFNAVLYTQDEKTGDAAFSKASFVEPDENVFIAGIDEMFEVELSGSYSVPANARQEYLEGFFRELYNKSITINHPGDSSSLDLCVYVPLFEEHYWRIAREFLAAIEAIPQSYNVDLFLLPYDLAFLFDPDASSLPARIGKYAECTKKVLNEILGARKVYSSLGKLVMLQNCNSQGLSLELNEDSFVRIAGEYAMLSVSNYPEMFPAAAQDPGRPLHALGLSVLSFDKFYFVQYLLHKAYAYILDRENVSQTEVDVNKVSQIVQGILCENVRIFTAFYDREIVRRLNDKMDQAEIISQIGPALNAEIERLTDEFQSYMDIPELSLPEKKATLAQLLGEDDDLLTGYMFNKKQLVIDDCSREVLDLFVEANNKICALDDTSEIEKAQIDRIKEYAALSKGGQPVKLASQLIDELKETKVTMRESTNYIRQKSLELEGLDIQRKDHKESYKRLTNDGFVFEGRTYRLQGDVEEPNLEEEYKPMQTVPPSIDLRASFTSVKDQGDMGACSAFAVVAIFEAILKKNGQTDIDLSEQFAYYNARRDETGTKKDSGCSLYSVIQTMTKDGICLENLFPYNPDKISMEPPKEAYDDAENRKIVKAKAVRKEIQDIKSAVCEGYPVAISLKIFNSFNPSKGFIPMPSDEEIAEGKSGNHAMVICGYNDEARFFVVRNSWGNKFGIKGYCYIPYTYIGNPELLNGACIITDISDTKLKVKGADHKATVSFDLTDSNIKSEILTNLIRDEKVKLGKLNKQLTERSRNFNTLFQQLGNNTVRESICDGTKERLDYECKQLRRQERDTQEQRLKELKAFDSETKRMKIYFWSFIAFVLFTYILSCVLLKSLEPLTYTSSYILDGVVVFSSVLFWLIVRRRKRVRKDIDMDYKDMLENLASSISSRVREKEIIHLKCHLAGMIIDSLYKLNRNLHSKYNGLRSYLGNLKTWREQEIASMDMCPLERDPFLTLISNGTLDEFFESNRDEITKGLELSRMFKDRYKVQEAEIVKFKNGLKSTLVKLLFESIKDFSIFKYVTNAADYPYVNRNYTDIDALMRQMDVKSNPFVRMNPTVVATEGINTYCKMMFLHTDEDDDRRKWEDACGRNFGNTPTLHSAESRFKVTLLQLKGVAPDEIGVLS
ncbi:MAG: C1 family peptidase [Candidatus Cryptobacteroides sp.]